jgi:hypothetical protein
LTLKEYRFDFLKLRAEVLGYGKYVTVSYACGIDEYKFSLCPKKMFQL